MSIHTAQYNKFAIPVNMCYKYQQLGVTGHIHCAFESRLRHL